jgi:phenylalanyl-tRNA synthetase beta chain
VPIRWLTEFVEIEMPAEELAERLTLAGMEVGAIEYIGIAPPKRAGIGLHAPWAGEGQAVKGLIWDREKIVVGQVVKVEPHPSADRLVVAHVDWGEGPVPSVTGAPNMTQNTKGVKVAVALPGAQIVNAYGDEPPRITVKTAVLRGVESKAVICSEKELGLSDDHTGVLVLDADAPLGTPLVELLGDEILDIELTPNLGRCLSIIGVAREVAALTEAKLKLRDPRWRATGEPVEEFARILIEDPELCPRYTAAIIHDIKSKGQAPFWMRYRLLLGGMRPISALVDITNYVMLEWGQPLHAFDYDKLKDRVGGKEPTIIVRRAKPGERITTLDGVERELDPEMLLICDEVGPIAIAGVMGGLDTEVDETTRHVLLESASFHALSNRRTAQKLQLYSEASHRFSRGVPPQLAERGAARAAELMRTLTGGTIAQGLLDEYPGRRGPTVIPFKTREVERLLGVRVEPKEIRKILERLGFECKRRAGGLDVAVPYWRLDVEIPADLVEEVARVLGYENLPATLMAEPLPPQRRNRSLELEERVREVLTGVGLAEVINYSLTSPESAAKLTPDGKPADGPYVELANPISRERRVMRRTLMNLLLETVAANQRHRDQVAIFEIGRVYLPEEPDADGLPREPRRLGIALAGQKHPISWATPRRPVDFYDLKGMIEELLRHLGVEGAELVPVVAAPFHPGRAAQLRLDGRTVGLLGEVHPVIAERFDLRGRVYLAELDLEGVLERAQIERVYRPIPRFPGIRLDLAVVVDEEVPSERVERLIREHGGRLLQRVVLFDVYRGEPVPPHQKSLAYALTYQVEDRTLTDEEAHTVHERIMAALERELNAQVRGLEA